MTRLPLLLLVIAYVALGSRPIAAGVLGLSLILPPFVRANANRMDSVAAALAVVFAGTWAFAVEPGANYLGGEPMKPIYEALALGAIAALAVRARFAKVDGGEEGSIAIAMIGVMALGRAQPKSLYVFVVAAFVVLAWIALRRLDPVRCVQPKGRAFGLAIVAAALAVGFTSAIAWVLPPLSDRVQSVAVEQFGGGGDTRQAGFSEAISLGDLSEILGSDALALRVYGPHVDHLRGIVYTRYGGGRWFAAMGARSKALETDTNLESRTVIVEHAGAPTDRWFVPLGAERIAAEHVRADRMGVLTPPSDERARRVGFDPVRVAHRATPPEEDDTAVPKVLRAELTKTASVWTAGATTDAARADRIEAKLGEFTYALKIPPRAAGQDPVLAFLENRTGHCEFFAAAQVLLLRTLGVPARVVGGYRVVERNELAGHWAVRNRNAHAWVEVWLDGRWVTRDPTPPAGLAEFMPKEPPSKWASIEDALGVAINRVGNWLLDRILWLAPTLVVLSLLFLFRREIAAWLRPTPPPVEVEGPLAYDDPVAAYLALEVRLAQRGFERSSWETLEDFASRLDAEPALTRAADVVRAHARARYGGLRAPDYSDQI